MTRIFLRRASLLAAVIVAAAAMGACGEQLDAGAACPSLCPGLSVPIKDTVLSPVLAFDSTLTGFPSIGTELGMPLAARGDTLDVRGVIRFDSLVRMYAPPSDSTRSVSRVDTAVLRMRLNLTQSKLPAWVRFEVYDVDTTAADDDNAAVLSLFTPGRAIASRTLTRAEITDSIVFPLSGAWLLNKVTSGAAVRVGLKLVASGPVSLRVHTMETGLQPEIRYYVHPDTNVHQVIVGPYSKTPLEPASLALDYRDYTIVARNTVTPTGPFVMSAGGLPARRTYLRFNIPQWLLDSTTIVRATLQLTQSPLRGLDARDSVTVIGQGVSASGTIADLYRSSHILLPAGAFVADSILVAPADSGVRSLELNALLRVWTGTQTTTSPQRAIVLLQREEGLHAGEIRFFNARAAASVRPRLRLSYIPRIHFGVP